MKLNGNKNIILDTDVTITDPNCIGDSLSEVLQRQQTDIEQLKSNVKWIYKYGGVGSGSGGGGGAGKWSIVATLDGKAIQNGNTISLDTNTSSYTLDIRISGATNSFYVEYGYGNISRSITLSAENGWREKIVIDLTSNGHISISASDGSVIKSVEADYITTPYIFSDITYYKSDLTSIWSSASKDIFMETAAIEGLYIGVDYTFAIKAQVSYKWEFLGEFFEGVIENSTGKIYIKVPDEILNSGDNAGLYSVKLTINVTPEGQTNIVIDKSDSFNLIPGSLYLKIAPSNSGEIIYNEVQTGDEFYKYSVNKTIGFNCKAYKGTNDNMSCTISFKTESLNPGSSEITTGQTNGFEMQNYLITMKFATEGWHKVTFTCTMDNESKSYVKYLYCFKVNSEYTWYKMANDALASSGGTIKKSMYYRVSPNSVSENFAMNADLNMTMGYSDILFDVNPNLVDGCTEFVINLGIQYNKINNTNNPIVGFSNQSGDEGILLYQNKINLGFPYYTGSSKTKEIFIPRAADFDSGNSSNYHLVTIAYTKANVNKETKAIRYQCCVYIDGILETAFQMFGTGSQPVATVKFYKGNYSVNLLDITYFDSDNGAINDVDINYYYNSYCITKDNVDVDPIVTSIINNFYDINVRGGATYSLENSLVRVQNTLVDNIAELTSIPTLVFKRDRVIAEQSNLSVIEWMNDTSYSQDTAGGRANIQVPVEVRWGKGLKATAPVKIDPKFNSSSFYIKLQGSSTMGNKSKNFTFGISTPVTEPYSVVFSPNYKSEGDNAKKTFLPEQSFTLKADVVDSSHSNNTAIGSFVNDNNNFEYECKTSQVGADKAIMDHVRQCLEGFPVLVYLELTDANKIYETETYYLGVYNFNLGRDSYFNLGYCDLSQLNGLNDVGDGFVFEDVDSTDPLFGVVAAEIQGNRKYWDFSQFDNSILFPIDSNDNSGEFMFGDIVANSNDTNYTTNIQNFVQNVAYSGGYIFNELGKDFEDVGDEKTDDSICYHTAKVVPDVKKQYKRYGPSYSNYKHSDFVVPSDVFTSPSYLNACINTEVDGDVNVPFLNYESVVYYYTTCMTFGLVDSVQKNLNIKTWNGKTFGLFFYDMDTSLGTSNSGGSTSYFCFSDYWNNKVKVITNEDGSVKETILNGVTIERDYYPLSHTEVSETGYDIPSSYLFAISKYVASLPQYSEFLSPQTVYARWRQKGGVLENSTTFIDKYYASNLKDVPPCLLNLNYRNKFLYSLTGDNFSTEYEGLKGTKIERTKEWLNGRLHILDAYFNLQKTSTRLNEEDDKITYVEPIPKVDNLSKNKDIYVLKDIFLNDEGGNTKFLTRGGECAFKVTADAYSPLIVTKAAKISRYLLVDPNVTYTINESFGGQETANFGGSDLWNSVESINGFVDSLAIKGSGFYMNSEKIEHIEGTSTGSISGQWKFVTPAAETIKLVGKNYSGSLTIDDSLFNLISLDLSGSKISVEVNKSKLRTLNLSNITCEKVGVTNCSELQNVNLTNATIGDLDIRPVWTKDIRLSNIKVNALHIQGKKDNNEYGTLVIENISTLTSLTFEGFKKVEIKGASKLQTIICNDSTNDILEEIVINNSPGLKNLTIPGETLHTLNLEGCNELSSITLKGNKFDKLRKLNLMYTKIKGFKFKTGSNEELKNYLDLSKFETLGISSDKNTSYIQLSNNPEIECIQFANKQNEPVWLHHPISNCSKLKRVYGNLKINCTQCFYNDKSFSIHGSDLSELHWYNRRILKEGRVQMPYEILGKTASNINPSDCYQSGEGVTNISLNGTSAYSDFSYTSCTIFDYYYFFTVCTNVENCNLTFAWTQNLDWGVFNWTQTADNSPNRNMFALSRNITSLESCFRQNITTETPKIRIFTPTEREPISEDGLFSPLKLTTTLSYIFLEYRIYTDRFIFRLPSDNFKLTTLAGLSIYLFVDDVNKIGYSDLDFNIDNPNILLNSGNVSNIFDNLNEVKSLYAFPNTTYIDYEMSSFVLPSSLEIIGSSFVSTYARGEIKFQDYVASCKNNLKIINSSFRVTDELVIGKSYKAKFYLNNNTFAGLKSIEVIGFGNPGNSNYDTTPNSYTASSFNGAGIDKIINETGFPYVIFTNTQSTNIKQLSGIFMNAAPEIAYNEVKLPSNMFTNLSKLEQTTAMFYNLNQDYKLSDSNGVNNFADCTSLKDVSYMFGQDSYDGDVQRTPRLSGSIPKKFFYHGGENIVVSEYLGADNVIKYDENGEVIEPIIENEESVSGFTYEQPYSTISNMAYCFARCNCDAYINLDIDKDLENNPNYSPKNWIYNSSTGTWTKNNKVDTNLQTAIWTYDGYNKPTSDCEQLDSIGEDSVDYRAGIVKYDEGADDSTPTSTLYYLAPPDLLRYCTSNANITGLFAYSGVGGWNSTWNNAGVHKYTYGLKGRICPYMLKPVSDTTSLNYLFASCKCLSYYEELDGNAYFIPSEFFSYANKITSLVGTFTDTLLPGNININVFDKLSLPLNITDLFYQCYWNGSENFPVNIDGVFKTSQISATKRAFCIVTDTTSQANRVRKQYIKFNNVFNPKYAGEMYTSNMDYSLTFAGYATSVIHEENKTLPNNTITNNYIVYEQQV